MLQRRDGKESYIPSIVEQPDWRAWRTAAKGAHGRRLARSLEQLRRSILDGDIARRIRQGLERGIFACDECGSRGIVFRLDPAKIRFHSRPRDHFTSKRWNEAKKAWEECDSFRVGTEAGWAEIDLLPDALEWPRLETSLGTRMVLSGAYAGRELITSSPGATREDLSARCGDPSTPTETLERTCPATRRQGSSKPAGKKPAIEMSTEILSNQWRKGDRKMRLWRQ
ncbi:MAG: hypothetical protein ACE5OZ_04390 [Candidatus Heimdallarchaeota archaeon]